MSKEGKGKDSGKNKRDSSDEDNTEKIRVGKDYQAVICPQNGSRGNLQALNEKALLLWKPTTEVSEEKLENYVKVG